MPPSSSKSRTRPHLQNLDYRGHIQGLTYLDDAEKPICNFFGGIPYALPPVGPLRWQRPQSLAPCFRYGHVGNPGVFTGSKTRCPQPGYLAPPRHDLWDEDCLQLNVWTPAGTPPPEGWPVLFYIHGGQLQFGTPNSIDARNLLGSDTSFRAIIVCPAYRLNLFGFMACRELADESKDGSVGNYGLWDQKEALEWTWKNISYFGGNAANITLAGHSAGAYSVFHLLGHYLFTQPKDKAIPFKRCMMLSNGPSVQPKRPAQLDRQFRLLVKGLVSPFQSGAELLNELREIDPKKLIAANDAMKSLHEFRACSDGVFVMKDLFASIDDGRFAARLVERNIPILLGETRDENTVYELWRPPRENTFESLRTRLNADYDSRAVDAALAIFCPEKELPVFKGKKVSNWQEAFGHIYAAMQVNALQRGFAHTLASQGADNLIRRYRIEWRAACADKSFKKEWGIAHSSDLDSIWFYGGMGSLTAAEKKIVDPWIEAFAHFVSGARNLVGPEWGYKVSSMRVLKPDGSTKVEVDGDDWHRGLQVWKAVRASQSQSKASEKAAKL